jgi:hypothetical protein
MKKKNLVIAVIVLAIGILAFSGCSCQDDCFTQADIQAAYDAGFLAYEGIQTPGYESVEGPGPVIVTLNGDIASLTAENETLTIENENLETDVGTLQLEIEELTSHQVELMYDDGAVDDFLAVGRVPGRGYLIDFTPPTEPFIIKKVKIYGNLFGLSEWYENNEFTLEIWDKGKKIIWTVSYPHTAKFTLDAQWVEIEVPNLVVYGRVYVHFFTCSRPDGGITIGYDSSIPNVHSELTEDWEVPPDRWKYFVTPKELYNWMIRVTGEEGL